MSIPESPREIYERNPLNEVICQLRFPAILRINPEQLPDFQQRIRHLYPLYEEDQATTPPHLEQILRKLSIQPQTLPVYNFINEAQTRKIALSREFVSLSDTAYERWEELRSSISMAQEALEEIFEPSFYSRVGLRYRNVIDPSALGLDPHPKWDRLLRKEFVGMFSARALSSDIELSRNETILSLPSVRKSTATIRSGLGVIEEAGKEDRYVYTIDSDFYTEEKMGGPDIPAVLREFNRMAGNFFRWAISADLRNALGPIEPDSR